MKLYLLLMNWRHLLMAKIESGLNFDKEEHHEKLTQRMKNLDTVQYPLRIPKNLYKKVKIKLVHDEVKLNHVLLEMLEQYIKE
jgi:hypothetical protein